jgi:hypothetical protein
MPYPARWGKISGNEIIRLEQEAASMLCGKGPCGCFTFLAGLG